MIRFSVGDPVVIRYGIHQGKKAKIMTSYPPDGYRVRVDDGYVLFFSSKGLEMDKGRCEPGILLNGAAFKPLGTQM